MKQKSEMVRHSVELADSRSNRNPEFIHLRR
jgi:hypothetical protein